MRLFKACKLYIDHVQVERHLSVHTISSYRRDLHTLCAYMQEQGVVETAQLTPEHLGGWLQHLAKRGLAAPSQSRACSAVRQLFLFLQRERWISTNPTHQLQGPTSHRPLPALVSVEEVTRVVEMPTEANPRSLRARAALELLYGTGLRASELCQLTLDDLQVQPGVIRCRGKGGKERLVPLGQPASEALQRYVQQARPALLKGHISGYVFIGNRAQALSRMGLFKMVRRYALAAGLPRLLSPHKLRHAFATHLLQGGADLRAVQDMLGHASISTTEIYTHIAQSALQKVVDTHHPLGQGYPTPDEME